MTRRHLLFGLILTCIASLPALAQEKTALLGAWEGTQVIGSPLKCTLSLGDGQLSGTCMTGVGNQPFTLTLTKKK